MQVLFKDEHLTLVLKPPGEVSQGQEQDIISATGGHIITRLDRPVGGLVLIANTKAAAAGLSQMLQQGQIEKTYLAVAQGEPEAEARLVNYIITDKRLNLSKAVNKGMPSAREAVLEYRLLQRQQGLSLLEVRLLTGRHHQIRLQLAQNGTPIWGDTKYNPAFKHKRGVVPGLFAYRLAFNHPITHEPLVFKALPDYGSFTAFNLEEILK